MWKKKGKNKNVRNSENVYFGKCVYIPRARQNYQQKNENPHTHPLSPGWIWIDKKFR